MLEGLILPSFLLHVTLSQVKLYPQQEQATTASESRTACDVHWAAARCASAAFTSRPLPISLISYNMYHSGKI